MTTEEVTAALAAIRAELTRLRCAVIERDMVIAVLTRERDEARRVCDGLAERVVQQSELLTRAAERGTMPVQSPEETQAMAMLAMVPEGFREVFDAAAKAGESVKVRLRPEYGGDLRRLVPLSIVLERVNDRLQQWVCYFTSPAAGGASVRVPYVGVVGIEP